MLIELRKGGDLGRTVGHLYKAEKAATLANDFFIVKHTDHGRSST